MILCNNALSIPAVALAGKFAYVIERPDGHYRDVVNETTSHDNGLILGLFTRLCLALFRLVMVLLLLITFGFHVFT